MYVSEFRLAITSVTSQVHSGIKVGTFRNKSQERVLLIITNCKIFTVLSFLKYLPTLQVSVHIFPFCCKNSF